jgi:O-acetyl-ADP-ribose deacetylase (regulator of RNase III)
VSTKQDFLNAVQYVTGDATSPQGDGRKIIAHITNNLGGWGSGFVLPLAKKYPQAELAYRRWADKRQHPSDNWLTEFPPFDLGEVQYVIVSPSVVVANMTAQDGYPSAENPHPCDLEALDLCLTDLFEFARQKRASIHMPRIGCGLGGATWDEIEECFWNAVVRSGSRPAITVYDFG